MHLPGSLKLGLERKVLADIWYNEFTIGAFG
jgi:hypothetical protein